MIRMTESAISTGVFFLLAKMTVTTWCQRLCVSPAAAHRRGGQLTVPADRSELAGVEAGAADEGAVHVLLPP